MPEFFLKIVHLLNYDTNIKPIKRRTISLEYSFLLSVLGSIDYLFDVLFHNLASFIDR